MEVRFEDFVLRQDETLARLESYLGVTLAMIPVNPEAGPNYHGFFAPAMEGYGYKMPPTTTAAKAAW